MYMSLMYTCQLCGANPFDYLTELRQSQQVGHHPQNWMPWNYRETIDGVTITASSETTHWPVPVPTTRLVTSVHLPIGGHSFPRCLQGRIPVMPTTHAANASHHKALVIYTPLLMTNSDPRTAAEGTRTYQPLFHAAGTVWGGRCQTGN